MITRKIRSFINLSKLLQENNIKNYWIDGGSILEYAKIKSLYIPGKKLDIGVLNNEYNKLIQLVNQPQNNVNSNMLNIIRYERKQDDVFPLKKDVFCGVLTNIPQNYTNLLASKIKSCCDFDDFISEPSSCPFVPIKEFPNLKDGIEYFKQTRNPYIGKNLKEFDNITTQAIKKYFKREDKIWAYTPDFSKSYEIPGNKLIKDWEKDRLDLNIVDAPSSDHSFFPEFVQKNSYKICEERRDQACGFNLTRQNNFTKYHIDPPFGDGWMYLTQGTKLWYVIHGDDYNHLEKNGVDIKSLEKNNFADMLNVLDGYLWGKIHVGVISNNDLIYFDHRSPHSVITYDKTIGLCGYGKWD